VAPSYVTDALIAWPPAGLSEKVEAEMLAGSIGSENVAVTVLFTATLVAFEPGTVESTVGAVVSTTQLRLAGDESVTPEAVARTWKVCEPSARDEYDRGEVQAANGAPSSAHSNDDPEMLEVKLNEALVLDVVPDGPEVIVVSGALGGGVPPARPLVTNTLSARRLNA